MSKRQEILGEIATELFGHMMSDEFEDGSDNNANKSAVLFLANKTEILPAIFAARGEDCDCGGNPDCAKCNGTEVVLDAATKREIMAEVERFVGVTV